VDYHSMHLVELLVELLVQLPHASQQE